MSGVALIGCVGCRLVAWRRALLAAAAGIVGHGTARGAVLAAATLRTGVRLSAATLAAGNMRCDALAAAPVAPLLLAAPAATQWAYGHIRGGAAQDAVGADFRAAVALPALACCLCLALVLDILILILALG